MDISKCTGEGCLLKDDCFRYTVKADEFYQSFFTEPPFDKETNKCKYLWRNYSEK